jgi:LasA protease
MKELAMSRSYVSGLRRTCASAAWLICAALVGCAPATKDEVPEEPSPASRGFVIDFNYSYEEMSAFDVEQFCKDEAPHLSPYAELISHVAGQRRVSPRALIALMEQQSHAVSDPAFSVSDPLGDLSKESGLAEQLHDVGIRIRRSADSDGLRVDVDAPDGGILTVIPARELEQLGEVYKSLFPGVVAQKSLVTQALSSSILMQFPWPAHQSWHFGGAHADDGSGFPLSSMDFSQGWESWGDPINSYVVASADGKVKKHSSCFVEVIHSGGWSTGYYHLGTISVQNGQTIKANDKIGKYANNQAQALCNGGSSTGPHVHWTLYSSGVEASLSGVALAGWKIHPGTSNYDEDCSRMYLSRNGAKKCTTDTIINGGIVAPPGGDQCPSDPKKTQPGDCGCGKLEPFDVPGFKDAQGYACSDWKGFDCTRAQEDDGYTSAQETKILASCSLSCGVCPN